MNWKIWHNEPTNKWPIFFSFFIILLVLHKMKSFEIYSRLKQRNTITHSSKNDTSNSFHFMQTIEQQQQQQQMREKLRFFVVQDFLKLWYKIRIFDVMKMHCTRIQNSRVMWIDSITVHRNTATATAVDAVITFE